MNTKKTIRSISAILLMAFGLLTLFLSASVVLDLFGIRAKEGNYVLLVVWANLISSIFYLLSAYGFLKIKNWTKLALGIASVILIISFILLKIRINNGGAYELKTVSGMIVRIIITIVFALIAYYTIQKDKLNILAK
ncbi:MAG: hypothetical protein WC389_10275 [Lutibacter sp.]|jgi:hypothetical protein